jgi:ATP-dependent Lhr-like helicase
VQEALWDLVWAGEVTNDAFAPLRAPRLTLARARKAPRPGARRFGSRRSGTQPTVQGRWALTDTIFRREPEPGQRRRTQAELLLERYGIVTREQVLAEGVPGGFSILYDALSQLETLGICRRGYFVEGLGGAQFALPGAVERLRAQRQLDEAPPLVLAATDPAQPYGAALPWPRRDDDSRRPARVRGAYVVLAGAEPVLYVEKGGRGIVTLVEPGDRRLYAAFEALAAFVMGGRGRKLSLERVDGEPVVGSGLEPMLVELGFRAGPSKLTLSA